MKVAFPVAPEPEADVAEAARLLFAGPVDFLKGVVAMDGLPPADRPEVAGVRSGARSFAVSLPAGTTTVLTIETKHATARPSATASPSGNGTPTPKATPGVPRATTRSGGQ